MASNSYRVAVVHKGAYAAATAYVPLDEVSYNGSSYRCKTACTGVVPTNTTNWVLVSSKGDAGAAGVDGADATAPVGSLIWFAANTAPANYLPANTGAAVSRTTYAALFAVIGTTYGAGNGTTTFNLPKITDFVRGFDPASGLVFGSNQEGTWIRTVAQEWSGSDLESGQFHIGTPYANADAEISSNLSTTVPTGAKAGAGNGYDTATTDNAIQGFAARDPLANVNHWIRMRPSHTLLLPCIRYK